jgi:UrcA family protein
MATKFIRIATSLALSGGLLAGPALARPAADGASTSVRFADLDLTTDAGAAALHSRVARAATAVCGDADQRDLAAASRMMACRGVAMASAAPQVELALNAARNGRAYAANDLKVTQRGF